MNYVNVNPCPHCKTGRLSKREGITDCMNCGWEDLSEERAISLETVAEEQWMGRKRGSRSPRHSGMKL